VALSLGFIVDTLGGELLGSRTLEIARLAPLHNARADELTFLSHARYQSQLAHCQAGAIVLSPALRELAGQRACIFTDDPYLYFSRLTRLWRAQHPLPQSARIHPSAVIDPTAKVADDAIVGPLCVVEAGAELGPRTRLHARVTVGHGCRIGADGIVHSGVVIGADGFGFAHHQGRWEKIEQLGAVRIGDGVEIGANTCIDRGALEDTVIEDGVKLDNLIQIGHNVRIGAHSALAGCVGVAGSAKIGAHCTIGGGAVVLGHLELADGVHISAASVVTRSVLKPGHYTGMFPLDENSQWEKNAASLKQLARLRDRLRELEQQVQSLQKEQP